ncbi:putative cysteine protease atg4 [Limtongia smithiae]|uniref:putative cysteine protease atg4 n=1 Tax=Limtongia smithiae TaxID=1125753 RepID=UPI0034CF2801
MMASLSRVVSQYLDPEKTLLRVMPGGDVEPITILGNVVASSPANSTLPSADAVSDAAAAEHNEKLEKRLQELKAAVGKLYLLTYRYDFPTIPKSVESPIHLTSVLLRGQLASLTQQGYTSDAGWGCMIRSTQTLLANSITQLWLRASSSAVTTTPPPTSNDALLRLFADDPRAPFSIHNYVAHGSKSFGIAPGNWFGPSAAAKCTRILVDQSPQCGLRVYIASDLADIYEDSLLDTAYGKEDPNIDTESHEKVFTPTLILVATKLGRDKIAKAYYEALRFALSIPQTVGIAGGQPRKSCYIYGFQSSTFFYLDPHENRPALRYLPDDSHATGAQTEYSANGDGLLEYTPEERESTRSRKIQNVDIKDMDPSMLIGFLVTSYDDLLDWYKRMREFSKTNFIHISRSQLPVESNYNSD